MSGKKNINTLLVWLLLVVILIIGVLFLKYPSLINSNLFSQNVNLENSFKSGNYENSEFSSSSSSNVVKSSSKRTIVTDRFVRKLDKNGNIVVMGSDGSMYNVKKGSVLVSGMVISVDEDSYDVYNIDSPVKSVSSE